MDPQFAPKLRPVVGLYVRQSAGARERALGR